MCTWARGIIGGHNDCLAAGTWRQAVICQNSRQSVRAFLRAVCSGVNLLNADFTLVMFPNTSFRHQPAATGVFQGHGATAALQESLTGAASYAVSAFPLHPVSVLGARYSEVLSSQI